MSRILVTGSTEGLGLAAARELAGAGHELVLHARSRERTAVFAGWQGRLAGIVIGDLASAHETRAMAGAVNDLGLLDAVIHNAGVFPRERGDTPEGHPLTLAVNLLAPYLLTALIARPRRLIYLSSNLHRSGKASFDDLDWRSRRWNTTQAYADSKLLLTALALGLARRWPQVACHAVDPGWVPTRMGGASAPDDLQEGHRTQTWLAVGNEPEALASGKYWRHRQAQAPAAAASDPAFQDRLLDVLARLTGVALP